jgi:uncharacterized protein (DUF1778 family)
MAEMNEARSERVDLRMTVSAKNTLQQAASVANKTLTEFLLDSGLTAAFRHSGGSACFSARRRTLAAV